MDELNLGQGQVAERPTAVTVFGVLSVVFGCYHLINASLSSYAVIMNAWNYPKTTTGQLIFLISLQALNACLWIWLIIVGIGLLLMKKWSRRQAAYYSWVQIILFFVMWSYNIIVACFYIPDKIIFMFLSMFKIIYVLIYAVLLLIFMQTQKVKRAFAAIGG